MRIRESAKLTLIVVAAIWLGALARVHAQKQKDEDLLNVTLITGDHAGADDVLRRYDKDKDGFLDKKEMAKLKWLSDPNRFDLNRNGRLTRLEIAIQFANLRKDFGVTLPDTYNATRMINLYDKNGDRQLNSDECRAFPWQTDLAELDVNKDKEVSVFEIAKKFAADYQQLGVEARDQWDALQYMRKHDADDNDHLDEKEFAKGNWPTDPARFDRDKDGRLTCMEIATGIAKNKLEAGIERSDQLVAARYMGRYDRNGDRKLDEEEISAGKWPKNPDSFDKNKDGIITIFELAERLSHNRRERGVEKPDRIAAAKLMARYDKNRNGSIDAKEVLDERAAVGVIDVDLFLEFDLNGDERMSQMEVRTYLAHVRKQREKKKK